MVKSLSNLFSPVSKAVKSISKDGNVVGVLGLKNMKHVRAEKNVLAGSKRKETKRILDTVKGPGIVMTGVSGDVDAEDMKREKEDSRNVIFNITIGSSSNTKGVEMLDSYDGEKHGSNKYIESKMQGGRQDLVDIKPNQVVHVNPGKYKDRIIDKNQIYGTPFNRVYDPKVFFDRHIEFPQSGRDVIMGKHFREHSDFGKTYLDKPFMDLIARKMGALTNYI